MATGAERHGGTAWALAACLLAGCGGSATPAGDPSKPPTEADIKQALATTLGGKLVVKDKVGLPGVKYPEIRINADNGPLGKVFLEDCQVAATLLSVKLKAPPEKTRMGNWSVKFTADQALDEPLYVFDHGQRIDQQLADVAQAYETSRKKAEPLPYDSRKLLDERRKQLDERWVANLTHRKGATQPLDGNAIVRWENGKWALDLESVLFKLRFDPSGLPASKIPPDIVKVDLEDRSTLAPWLAGRQELARKVDFMLSAQEGKSGYAAIWQANLELLRSLRKELLDAGPKDGAKVAAALTRHAESVRGIVQALRKLDPPTPDDNEAYAGLYHDALEEVDSVVLKQVKELQLELPKYDPTDRNTLAAALQELRVVQQTYLRTLSEKLKAAK